MERRGLVHKEMPCGELFDKKYVEVITDENLRSQLYYCLNNMIFKIDGLIFHREENYLMIEFPAEFFNKQDFIWGGKPSDTKLRKFYSILKNLQIKRNNDFIIDSLAKPSSTNLVLKLKFPLFKVGKPNELLIKDLINYLSDLWTWISYKLSVYGYNI